MAHTISIDHLVTSTEAVNIEVADKANMVLLATSRMTGGKDGWESVYGIGNGDSKYPARVTYGVENTERKGNPVRRISMKFETWAADDDGVSVVIRKPIAVEMSFNLPADLTVELADLDDLFGNAVSFLYSSVSSGTRTTTYLQKLLYGGPQVA